MAQQNVGNSFFMRVEESERIRQTVQTRLQKCVEWRGQKREFGDLKQLAQQVATACFLADISKTTGSPSSVDRSDTMVVLSVGNPYPPCNTSIHDLQTMKLSDLRLETHHRGRVLHLRRVTPVVELVGSSWTVMSDEASDEVHRVELTLHKSRAGADVLASGEHFAIKEPYFTINDRDEPSIRIDHPSDIIVLPKTSIDKRRDSASNLSCPLDDIIRNAAQCKEDGNAALRSNDMLKAHACYTKGVELIQGRPETTGGLVFDILRNRAYINLALKRFDDAKADAKASITGVGDSKHDKLDSKAYFRAGCAAYNLRGFEEAKTLFERQEELAPGDKDAQRYRRKAAARITEETTGGYDWTRIKAAMSTTRSRADVADFIQQTAVKESPGRGRGLFAVCDLAPGAIVLCEKALCVSWSGEEDAWAAMTYDFRDERIRGFPAGLAKLVVEQLLNNPSQIGKVLGLYGDYQGLGKSPVMVEGAPVIDTFQIHDIVARNAFGPGPPSFGGRRAEEDVRAASAGLWIQAAHINHSCVPNAKVEYIGDLMVIRATRPIRVGEEITHSYDGSVDYDARTAALMTTWGFECHCPLCVAEGGDGPETRRKRHGRQKVRAFR